MHETEAKARLDRFEADIWNLVSKPVSRAELGTIHAMHRNVVAPEQVRKLAHIRKDPFDFIFGEIMPALPVIDAFYSNEDFRFHFLRDGGPTDLRMLLGDSVEEVQITRVHDGQRSRLQNEMLAESGWAPATGDIYREKKTGRVIGTSEAQDEVEALYELEKWLSHALKNKAAKAYPPGMTLIVGISRFEFFLYDERDFDPVVEIASRHLPQLNFAKIYLSELCDGTFVRRLR